MKGQLPARGAVFGALERDVEDAIDARNPFDMQSAARQDAEI